MTHIDPINTIAPVIDGANVPIVRVYAPEVDLATPKQYIAYQGAKDVSYQPVKANTFTGSQMAFTVYVPSLNTVVDRKMMIKYRVQHVITKTGAPAAPITALGWATTFGVRQLPLHSSSSSVSCDFGGAKMTWNARQQCHAFSLLNQTEFSRRKFGGVLMPDQLPRPLNGVEARNQFAHYESNNLEETRNLDNFVKSVEYFNAAGQRLAVNGIKFVYPDDDIDWGPPGFNPADPATDVYRIVTTFEIYEPFFISPFVLDERVPGLCGINQLNINFNISDLRLCFQGQVNVTPALDATYSMSVVPVADSAVILPCFYTMPSTYTPHITSNVYCTYDCSSMTTMTPPIPPQLVTNDLVTTQITTSYTTFRQHPKYIVIYAKPTENDEIYAGAPDREIFATYNSFLRITQAQISYNNRNGLLSGADEFSLYSISLKNGLNQTFAQWRGCQGSVLVLTPLDLGIDDEAIGVKGKFSFQAQLHLARQVESRPVGAIPYEVVVVPVYDEILYTNMEGLLVRGDGNINASKLLSAPIEHGGFAKYNASGLYGGGFWDSLKSVANSVSGWVSKLARPIAGVVSTIAPEFSGIANGIANGVSDVANYVKQSTGGRFLSAAQLRRRIR